MSNYYSKIIKILKIFTTPLARVSVEGKENIPVNGGALLVINHISNLDPIIAGVQIADRRPVRALAKASLFSKPIIGNVLRKMEHIPVLRNTSTAAEAYSAAIEKLKTGEVIAIYPEGTIPVDINTLGDFKTGAARLALATGVPIIPIGQWGIHRVLPARQNALKPLVKALFTRPKHVLVVGEPITIPTEDSGFDAKKLTFVIKENINKLTSIAKEKS